MNKKEFIARVSNYTWVSERAIKSVLEACAAVINNALYRGEEIHLGSFGVFKQQERAPRTGRNPHTGEAVPIPARFVPVFKPGADLNSTIRIKKGE